MELTVARLCPPVRSAFGRIANRNKLASLVSLQAVCARGIGASNVTIVETNATRASLADNTTVTATGASGLTAPTGFRNAQGNLQFVPVRGIAVVATAKENITTIAAGASGGKVGLAGSVTVTTLDLSTSSSVGGNSTINAPLSIIATDDTQVSGGGGSGTLGAYGGVGAGIDVQTVKKSVLANVGSNATVAPSIEGDVVIRALSTGNQLSVSAAVSAGVYSGIAGGASGIDSNNRTQAILGGGSRVTTRGSVVVAAEDTSSATGIAGSVGASQAAGVGASVGVAIVKKDTFAIIQTGSQVVANPTPRASAVFADGNFGITDQLPVGGLFNPSTDINAQSQTIRLDSAHRFKPGAAQAVQYSAGGGPTVPGLSPGQTYYVIVVDSVTVQLATTVRRLARAYRTLSTTNPRRALPQFNAAWARATPHSRWTRSDRGQQITDILAFHSTGPHSYSDKHPRRSCVRSNLGRVSNRMQHQGCWVAGGCPYFCGG